MREEIFFNPQINEEFFRARSLMFIVGEEESAFNRLEMTSIEPESGWDWNTINFNLTRTVPPPNFVLPSDDSPRFWHFVIDVAYWILEPHRNFMINIDSPYHIGTPTPIEPELLAYAITATPIILNFGTMRQGETLPAAQTITITNTGTENLTLNSLPTVAGFTLGNIASPNIEPEQSITLTVQPNAGLPVGNHNQTFTISTVEGASADIELRFVVEQAQITNNNNNHTGGWRQTPVVITPMSPQLWENPFVDVRESDWFYSYVEFAYQNNLMNGVSPTQFAHNSPTTRAMFVTVLWRLAGEPTANTPSGFTDVSAETWYAEAIAWAAENGIVLGVGENLFAPHREITREHMGLILYRLIGDEVDEIMDRNYVPQNIATRAEIAAILQRLYNI